MPAGVIYIIWGGKKGDVNIQENELYLLNRDIIFKNVFNTEETLKKLLESILPLKINEIKSINTELEKINVNTKKMVLDLVLDTDMGIVNVEVNNGSQEYIYNRNFLYFNRLVGSSLKKEDTYDKLTPHFQINISWGLQRFFDYDISDEGIFDVVLFNRNKGKTLYENEYKIIYVNMDYFEKKCYTECNEEEKFLKFISSKNKEELEKFCKGDKIMEKIKRNVLKLNTDKDLIESLYVEGEEERMLNTERKLGFESGQVTIAKNMLSKGMNIQDISDVTGLTAEEINKLK